MPEPAAVSKQVQRCEYVVKLTYESVCESVSVVREQHLQHGWKCSPSGQVEMDWGTTPAAEGSGQRSEQQRRRQQSSTRAGGRMQNQMRNASDATAPVTQPSGLPAEAAPGPNLNTMPAARAARGGQGKCNCEPPGCGSNCWCVKAKQFCTVACRCKSDCFNCGEVTDTETEPETTDEADEMSEATSMAVEDSEAADDELLVAGLVAAGAQPIRASDRTEREIDEMIEGGVVDMFESDDDECSA